MADERVEDADGADAEQEALQNDAHVSGADAGKASTSNVPSGGAGDAQQPNAVRDQTDIGGGAEEDVSEIPNADQQDASDESARAALKDRKEAGSSGQQQGSAQSGTLDESEGGAENPSDLQEDRDAAAQRRQRGDVSKEWMRRLEAIPDAKNQEKEDAQDRAPKGDSKDGDVEFTHDDDVDSEQDMMQAAGAADGLEKQDGIRDFDQMRLQDDELPAEMKTSTDVLPAAGDLASQYFPAESEERADDLPAGESRANKQPDDFDALDGLQIKPEGSDRAMEDEPQELEKLDEEDKLHLWYDSGRNSMDPGEVWQTYEGITRDLSFTLTEALRLVLEPTLASRLKGDYRTGKRLNMKKIIPFIASDYTKDKIWLRRTRPSQREYQICLALDDSRSMSDSHSVHLAFQALALVSQALGKLEAGEMSICRFGEDVDFIHDFQDGPVSQSVGKSIIESFTFQQRGTDIRKLLSSSLKHLAEARQNRSSTAAELWQLQMIISDGICQDLDDIRALLRQAREQKVMVVFIVIDSLHQQASTTPAGAGSSKGGNHNANAGAAPDRNSILSMNSVSYVRGPDGALELKMERYMDSFPFEYYLVLRDVSALPEILSETLRQFFERVSKV